MSTDASLADVLDQVTFEELERDPYPFYARLREEAPVAYVPGIGEWLITGFDEVKAVHGNPVNFAARQSAESIECIGENNVLALDGTRHQRYRRSLHACLAPRMVAGYAERTILPVVEQQLERLSRQTRAELMSEYFEPISVLSLGQIMGVPEIEADMLRRWFHGIILGNSNMANVREIAEEANGISREIDDRMWEVFERLDGDDSDTIVSHLLRHAEGQTLKARVDDITPTMKIIIAGGLQEPGHAAGTLMYALLRDQDLRDRFAVDHRELIDPAIEEALRWVAPIQFGSRLTTDDIELGGAIIPSGVFVLTSFAAANRDRRVFGNDAEDFNIGRPKAQHLGFGFGSHFCSGSSFGRAVMRFAVQRLFERCPSIRLDPSADSFFRGFVFRAPAALHARWD